MASVFTKIISGELPCYKIFESERVFSFLALDQVTLGHCLVVPKREQDHWFDVDEGDFLEVQLASRVVGRAIKKALGAPRILTATVGFEVPHYHLHLIPASGIADLNFSKAIRQPPEVMKEIQSKILTQLN